MNDYGQLASQQQPSMMPLIIMGLFSLVVVAAMWKVFTKAGKPGWAAIVPIYNIVVLLEIAGKPLWWIALFFVPLVSLVAAFLIMIGVAKAFGKGTGFGIGLTLLGFIFFPILGFGSAQYVGTPSGTGVRRAA
jgi:hypothetical protein